MREPRASGALGVPADTTSRVEAPLAHDFAAFFRSEWPRTVQAAALLTQRRSVAEDLAQDAFARVLRAWNRVEDPPAFLRTTLVNVCRTWQRRERGLRERLPRLSVPTSTDAVGDELADALDALPERQRTVLILRYWMDLSEAEIASAVGCRPGTVKSLCARALEQLERVIPR